MGKPYADDLRKVAVRLIVEYHTRPEVGRSRNSAASASARSAATSGGIAPPAASVRPGSVATSPYALARHAALIKRWIAKQPDLTLLELQARLAEANVTVAVSSVFRFLDHLKLTFKQKVLHAAEQDRPDVAAMRRR